VAQWDSENPEQPERTLARVSDLSLVYYSGLLSQRPRSAPARRAVLGGYLTITVHVNQIK
jgi:hypothetical protein